MSGLPVMYGASAFSWAGNPQTAPTSTAPAFYFEPIPVAAQPSANSTGIVLNATQEVWNGSPTGIPLSVGAAKFAWNDQADLPFAEPEDAPWSDEVNLNFGSDTKEPVFLDALFHEGGVAAFAVSTPMVLGDIEFGEGVQVGHVSPQLRDPRNYPDVQSDVSPFNQGLAWRAGARSAGSWPVSYTLTSSWRHFYTLGFGVPLTTSPPSFLVTPALHSSSPELIFGATYPALPVYTSAAPFLVAENGDSLSASLSLDFVGLGHQNHSGEVLVFALTPDRRLEWAGRGGEAMAINIQVESARTDCYTGESVSVSLDVYDLVGNTARTGESVEATLATTSLLAPSSHDGDSLAVVLETRPLFTPASTSHTGEAFTFTVYTSVIVAATGATGEAFTLSLAAAERADLGVAATTGDSVSLVLQTSVALGSPPARTGEVLSINGLDEVPNFKAATGERLDATLETTQSVDAWGSEGNRLDVVLTTVGAKTLDMRFSTGEWVESSAPRVAVSARLDVVFFEGLGVVATESTSTTSLDLEGDPLCYSTTIPWVVEANHIEMEEVLPSFVYARGTDVRMTVSLSCRPRFSVTAVTGETFTTSSDSRYVSAVSSYGEGITTAQWLYIEPLTRLCYPNSFPNPDAMEVELEVEEGSCEADFMFEGVAARASLSVVKQYTAAGAYGEAMAFDFVVEKPWAVVFPTSPVFTATLSTQPSLSAVMYDGVAAKATAEEPSALAHTGEVFTAALHTTVDVEFLERGCVGNDHIWIDENGDAIADLTHGVGVEGMEFSHDLKARCF